MADPRFFNRLGPLTLTEIAALSGAAISDSGAGDATIDMLAPLASAEPGVLAYADNPAAIRGLPDDKRLDGVFVLAPEPLIPDLEGRGAIVLTHTHPRGGFARAAAALFVVRPMPVGEAVSATAKLGADVRMSPGVVIGEDAVIGDGVALGPGAVIGAGCHIGAGSRIGAHAVIQCSDIGQDCNIFAGAVIGEAGFGVAVSDQGLADVPHLGSVEIGDRVTIGANSCIDRGVFGPTRIGEGTKIDNLCHIGHNCQVGKNVVMAAYAGVSGSCTIGDGVMFGGRVGTHDHIEIGAGARVGGNSAVGRNIPPGQTWLGSPAQPIEAEMKQIAALRRLYRTTKKKKD
ncbi:UDP-3-O-(3-hydroxymyristoyl)glucosamine N-acyltransferase [Maricaulis alexandrii]|uniref:UDP-3-O-(3-hydroxymyristoyl)glucosamine N-acyltransferase n=1 Tax=Maricaulis alexandrii TaxID=2570354 RepID=UPI0011080A34|nr:UDP-3-O-(3-hydroxymyristoyl)glucosamine N-acyltransferase [Maricaulis alexandrii]